MKDYFLGRDHSRFEAVFYCGFGAAFDGTLGSLLLCVGALLVMHIVVGMLRSRYGDEQ